MKFNGHDVVAFAQMTPRTAQTTHAVWPWLYYEIIYVLLLLRSSQAVRSDPVDINATLPATQHGGSDNSSFYTPSGSNRVTIQLLPHTEARTPAVVWPREADSNLKTADDKYAASLNRGDGDDGTLGSGWVPASMEIQGQMEDNSRRRGRKLQVNNRWDYCLTARNQTSCYPCLDREFGDYYGGPCRVSLRAERTQ